ncbi:MAG TPA: hypothetical protein VFV49_16370 [Thermoanaerobaculia bacterium]|nr:hypothetical protein [Thermoanaerobaculia bacterium]
MAMFVHLAPDNRVEKIRRNGIRRLRKATAAYPGGVFAVPVTQNFYISHQWLRELRRRGVRTFVGIYFRIPDDTTVWLGHYGQKHLEMTAAEAVGAFGAAEDRQGWQVVIPSRVDAKQIHRIRDLPQVLGWRYSPTVRGKAPCPCDFCTRGKYGAAKLRRAYRERQARG